MSKSSTIIRVFPRRTSATPVDSLTVINRGPGLGLGYDFDAVDEVHVSCTFTWDLPRAHWLVRQWGRVADVKLGGPALDAKGGEFVVGRYLKPGCVITSRGCPNHCWFCAAWRREGRKIRELEIKDGWNVFDNNILACSEKHVRNVFRMLRRQSEPIEFTGGLEAKILQRWHAKLLASIRFNSVYFAYDTPDDWEPLVNASKLLQSVSGLNFNSAKSLSSSDLISYKFRCYVLIGYKKDTIEKAVDRLTRTCKLGFVPFAMLFNKDIQSGEWRATQRLWSGNKRQVSAKFKSILTGAQ